MTEHRHFPYGNDLRNPGDWLGHYQTKSRRWMATYIGGWPFTALFNGHTIALYGLESMTAAIVTLYSFGVSGSVNPGKVISWSGGRRGQAPEGLSRRRGGADRAQDTMERGRDLEGRRQQIQNIGEINSAIDIYNICQGHATVIDCMNPMSLADLDGADGAFGGFEIELIGAASYYLITANRGAHHYFGDQHVYNIGGGAIGITAGIGGGTWGIRKWYNGAGLYDPDNDLPLEVRRDGESQTVLEGLGGMKQVNLAHKPFYRYHQAPAYIRNLPGIYQPISDDVIAMGEEFANQQRIDFP